MQQVYKRLARLVPPSGKVFARIAVESCLEVGRKSHFTQFGEDAFLQGYFERKACLRGGSGWAPFARPRIEKGFYPANQEICFLSVDTESHDLDVLQSNDWLRFHPELIVVEDQKQSVEEISCSAITGFLTGAGYRLCAWIRPSVVYSDVERREAPVE